jgi:hypothetical protein
MSKDDKTPTKGSAKGSVDPHTLEKQLLENARKHTSTHTRAPSETSEYEDVRAISDSMIVPLCEHGRTIAMSDLEGRVAVPMEFYEPTKFVCHHCLLPAQGLCFSYPVGGGIDARTKKTMWIVRNKFGSVGCALRYVNDNRYTFATQTIDMVPNMLKRVYGVTHDVREIPRCPKRTVLPPFVSPAVPKAVFGPPLPPKKEEKGKGNEEEDADDAHEARIIAIMKKAAAEGKCQGLALHGALSIPMKTPDRNKHQIEFEPSSVLIDAHCAPERLGFGVRKLAEMFPGFCIRKPRTDGNGSSLESMPAPSRPLPESTSSS